MEQNKYTESDIKCCQWLDELMNEPCITLDHCALLLRIKTIITDYPEELESVRGKFLAFVKDESGEYQLSEYAFDNCIHAAEHGLSDAFLFFVPNETSYCSTASSPYRNAIESPSNNYMCIIS